MSALYFVVDTLTDRLQPLTNAVIDKVYAGKPQNVVDQEAPLAKVVAPYLASRVIVSIAACVTASFFFGTTCPIISAASLVVSLYCAIAAQSISCTASTLTEVSGRTWYKIGGPLLAAGNLQAADTFQAKLSKSLKDHPVKTAGAWLLDVIVERSLIKILPREALIRMETELLGAIRGLTCITVANLAYITTCPIAAIATAIFALYAGVACCNTIRSAEITYLRLKDVAQGKLSFDPLARQRIGLIEAVVYRLIEPITRGIINRSKMQEDPLLTKEKFLKISSPFIVYRALECMTAMILAGLTLASSPLFSIVCSITAIYAATEFHYIKQEMQTVLVNLNHLDRKAAAPIFLKFLKWIEKKESFLAIKAKEAHEMLIDRIAFEAGF